MQPFHMALPTGPRLRVVFGDSIVSFGFSPSASFADIAEWIDEVAQSHDDAPLAIDITLATADLRTRRATEARPSEHS